MPEIESNLKINLYIKELLHQYNEAFLIMNY